MIVLLLLLQAQPAQSLDWVDRTACPVWEPCGDGGERCWWRAHQFEKDPGCFDELTAMACEAGQSDACLRQDLTNTSGAGRVHAYLKAVLGDLAHHRDHFFRPELLALLGLLFLLKAFLLRQMGWRSKLVAARDALIASVVSAPIVLLGIGEFDKLAWWGPLAAWLLTILVEWAVLRRLQPGPMHSAFGAAAGTNTMAGLIALAVAVSWSKWGPRITDLSFSAVPQAFHEASRGLSSHGKTVVLFIAAVLALESVLLRLLRWGPFPRSLRDALVMNVVGLPVGAAVFVTTGALVHHSTGAALLWAVIAGWLAAVLIKWSALSMVTPDAIHRPGLMAFVSTTLTVLVGVGVVLLAR